MFHPYEYSDNPDQSDDDVNSNSYSEHDQFSDSDEENKIPARKSRKSRGKGENIPRRNTQTPSRHTPKESSCVVVSKHFADNYRRTSERGDLDSFKHLLKKSPIPVLLHYMHYLFYANRCNDENTKILMAFNGKYNIVSRYFLKALSSESRTKTSMESYEKVSKMLSRRIPLEDIGEIHHFTPEFICMEFIQAGNLVSFDKLFSEWELTDGFKLSCDLIAAFFGIKSFFSDESRYVCRQSLFISCICGGNVSTLSKIVKMTNSKWLNDYTMRKTREICIPPTEMLNHLESKYKLTM